jgi:hypothetical protein
MRVTVGRPTLADDPTPLLNRSFVDRRPMPTGGEWRGHRSPIEAWPATLGIISSAQTASSTAQATANSTEHCTPSSWCECDKAPRSRADHPLAGSVDGASRRLRQR